jgi:hypothetical protein
MSTENRKNENAKLYVRLCCGSPEHLQPIPLDIPTDSPTADDNLKVFIIEHVHKGGDLASIEEDGAVLYTVLEKCFREGLPKISRIMERRKLTFGFEVKLGK